MRRRTRRSTQPLDCTLGMQTPKDWYERFDAEPTDVERWAAARERSALRNRSWFLYVSGLFILVFSPLLIDAYLVVNVPAWRTLVGLDASTAPFMLSLSSVMAGASLAAHILIRLFWKRPAA